MAKKSKPKRKLKLSRSNVLLAFLVVVGTSILVYFLVIQNIQAHSQRKELEKAEVELSSLADRIQEKIGKADDIKTEKSCSYASRPYGNGPLRCGVSVNVLYSDKNSLESSALMLSAASIAGKSTLLSLADEVSGFKPLSESKANQQISQSYGKIGELICEIHYIYPVVSEAIEPFYPTHPENLQITLSCGGPAMKEFYPATD